MSWKCFRLLTALLALCLILPPAAVGQGIGGKISGRVLDQSGLGVAGAPVRIVNSATNQSRTVSTDSEGRYEASELPPGLYDVTVEQSGFKTVIIQAARLGVGQNARLQTVVLEPIPVEEKIEVKANAEVSMVDATTPTLSTSFSDKQIREIPVLTRDINNLALLAPGVFSVRAFSFASTLVPFAANGSRGRDNNFIIDSVDNNEPLFGGAATQFTNTDLFAEYRILTNQYKAEYGRNSGSVVNIITERGGNQWHGSAFWFGQSDNFNARSSVEKAAQLSGTTRFYENIAGATLGGPIKKESTWVFASYQWDFARNDLSPVYPLVSTMPTTQGLQDLSFFGPTPTLDALFAVPSVLRVPSLTAPCGQPSSGLPPTNPCTVGAVPVGGFPIDFGTYLVPQAGVFDVHDHQLSLRVDQRITARDDFYFRYLLDDLTTPRTTGAQPAEVAFSDLGLFPDYRVIFKQRTQNLGLFWTHAWPTALHELRGSYSRISSQAGALDVPFAQRETQPALTVVDFFAFNTAPGGTPAGTASLLNSFPSAGQIFTIGRDSRPTNVNTNIFQVQENVSITTGRHSIKFGVNFVRTQSNIRQTPSDLGQYLYFTMDDYVANLPFFALQRFPNFQGTVGDVLPLREFAQFYFFQDDIQVQSNLVISLGLRYEHWGQVINSLSSINPTFAPPLDTDQNNFAPRVGFAWSPASNWVIRGGYGFFYNPTVFNIPLLAWQSGPVSPFLVGVPNNVFPAKPFPASELSRSAATCAALDAVFSSFPRPVVPAGPATPLTCTAQDTITRDFVQPYSQTYSLSLQRQWGRDTLFEVNYVGTKGTKLFQRVDRNPTQGWQIETTASATCATPPCIRLRPRITNTRGPITEVTNGARSIYHALQVAGTHRLSSRYGLAVTGAYTWSHMIDNASEIFGPGIRLFGSLLGGVTQSSLTAIEAITPIAQNPNDTLFGERGDSSFDRRHRVSASFLWLVPAPGGEGWQRHLLSDWQINGFFTYQSGAPFGAINSFNNCPDAFGDGNRTNDRPDIGNPNAPADTVALLNNRFCLDPRDTDPAIQALISNPANQIVAGAGAYITPDGSPAVTNAVRFVQVGRNRLGNAGRNILVGPNFINFDVAVFKNIPWGERRSIQLRAEAYNVFNRANPGNPIGNVFVTDAQPVPAIAFSTSLSPARVIGTIPENSLDARDATTGSGLFLSERFMNTNARKFQFAVKFLF
jgi:hypothetical protein